MPTPCAVPAPDTLPPLVLALGGLVALASAVGIGRFVYTPILPLMVDDRGMPQGTAGLLASANFAGYHAGALLAATPILPGSRRRWLIIALIVSSLTTAGMRFVPGGFPGTVLCRWRGQCFRARLGFGSGARSSRGSPCLRFLSCMIACRSGR